MMTGELTVAEKTSTGSLVQANKTQIPDNPHGGSPRNTFNVLREFTLDLQADLDNLKGVREDLLLSSARSSQWFVAHGNIPLDIHRPYHRPESQQAA